MESLSIAQAGSRSMQSCIDACSHCYQTCLQMAMGYCLERGARHVEPDHFRLMLSCAEVCQTSANLQLCGSSFSPSMCELCADICDACADSCRSLDGMDECVHACMACADSCRAMSRIPH